MNLSSVDLNRLLVLHAVLTERSVTRAAAVLHVTPSAVSNALARLRATFDDPLLVRSGRGLTLTPRATALAPQLAEAVAAMARVVDDQSDSIPPAARGRSRWPAPTPNRFQKSRGSPRRSPASFRTRALRILSVDQLESRGGLAGARSTRRSPRPTVLSGTCTAADLYQEEGVLVVRKGHPQVRRRMSKEQFNTLRHIDILLALGGPGIGHRIVEEFFASHGLHRDIAISVPSFAAAAAIAAQTDWVAGMPRRMATVFLRQMPLMTVALPVPPLPFRIQLVWHERTHADAGARFFRSVFVAAVQSRQTIRGSESRRER